MDPWKLTPAADHGLPPAERARSLRRENGLLEAGVQLGCWAALRGYFALWHRLAIVGREHLPKRAPFVLVANHSSHLDALALAAALPPGLRDRVFPLAAGDTFFERAGTSVFSALVLNALPLWRQRGGGRHALDDLRRRLLEEPCAYVLFPEGTRSRDGRMAAFRSGLGMLIAGTPAPVVPCALVGAFEAFPATGGNKLPRPRKISLRLGPPLLFADAGNDRAGWARVASESEAAVRALLAASHQLHAQANTANP